MKFKSALVLTIALIGTVSASGLLDIFFESYGGLKDGNAKPSPNKPLGIVDPFGLAPGNVAASSLGQCFSDKAGESLLGFGSAPNFLKFFKDYFSYANKQFFELILAMDDDVQTSSSRFLNSKFNHQYQKNIETFFGNVQSLLNLLQKGLLGNISVYDFVKENIQELIRLVSDIIIGLINLIKAGISANHLMPKTYEKLKAIFKCLIKDVKSLLMDPMQLLNNFSSLSGNLNLMRNFNPMDPKFLDDPLSRIGDGLMNILGSGNTNWFNQFG